jgi:hypothetical protein
MLTNRISLWAGYAASFFSIAYFIMVTTVFLAGWITAATGWCIMLAASSGVVCLVSGIFGFVRRRRDLSGGVPTMERPRRKFHLDE